MNYDTFLYICAVNFRGVNRARGVFAVIFLTLFLFLWSSSNLFYHSHVVDNKTITHSHPYSTSEHTHNILEIQLINLFSFDLALLLVFCLLFVPIEFGYNRIVLSKNHLVYNFVGALFSLRAPPAISC